MPKHSSPRRGAEDIEIKLRKMQRELKALKRFSRSSRTRECRIKSPRSARSLFRSRSRSRSRSNSSTARHRRRFRRIISSSSSESDGDGEANKERSDQNYGSDSAVIESEGRFDSVGIATGYPDETIGKVQALRLHVHSESDNWAILSEIHIQDELASR